MEKNKTHILLKICWVTGIITNMTAGICSSISMATDILFHVSFMPILMLPSILYFFASPLWLILSVIALIKSINNNDKENTKKAAISTAGYLLLSLLSCYTGFVGMSI